MIGMLPRQDETLLALIRCHIEDGGPLEPIVDRCIEMGHHASDMDWYSNIALHRVGSPISMYLSAVANKVDEALRDLGHDELADYIPL
jgi:hypothetical protein